MIQIHLGPSGMFCTVTQVIAVRPRLIQDENVVAIMWEFQCLKMVGGWETEVGMDKYHGDGRRGGPMMRSEVSLSPREIGA